MTSNPKQNGQKTEHKKTKNQFFSKETLWPLFKERDNYQLKPAEPLPGDSLFFTTKFQRVAGTHLVEMNC